MSELFEMTACEAVRGLCAGEFSSAELLDAAAARIAACEPHINALPTLCFDRAREHAARMDAGRAPTGVLHGLPIAIKDLNPVQGVRATYGSPNLPRLHRPALGCPGRSGGAAGRAGGGQVEYTRIRGRRKHV